MRCLSPAKLNLHLRVGGVRLDGFHPLRSWMVTVGLFDTLNFLLSTAENGEVDLQCTDPELPTDGRNLIIRAAALLRAEVGKTKLRGVRVDLVKAIPMGGGLGGGSSDAATTLVTLNKSWAMNLGSDRLLSLAAQLGSDVPFFVRALLLGTSSALCTGRGERIVAIPAPACRWAVLVLPSFPMPTAAVYERLDTLRKENFDEPADDDLTGWDALPAVDLLQRLVNDLETPAFDLRADLGHLRDAVEAVVDRPVRMSGSGSTLFTLFDSNEGPEQARQEIHRQLAPKWTLRVLTVRIAP